MSSRIKWKGSGTSPRTNRVAPLAIPAGFNYDFSLPRLLSCLSLPAAPLQPSMTDQSQWSSNFFYFCILSSRAHDRRHHTTPYRYRSITPQLRTRYVHTHIHTPSTNCCQMAESNQRTCRQRISRNYYHTATAW